MLDLHRLMLLREVKLRGSMTAAARELSYSHSAISQQLAQLERETGVVLLERVGRNVQLTAAGEELVRNTHAIMAAVERAESDLATSHRYPRGVLRVAAFATISRNVLPTAMVELAQTHPGIEIRLRLAAPEAAAVLLTSRQVDAVLTDTYPGVAQLSSGGLHVTTLGTDPVRGYLPDPSFDGDIEKVRDVLWTMEPSSAASAQWAVRVCRERGFEPLIAHESTDLLFHVRMVERGLAAAFLPDMVVREFSSGLVPSEWLPTDQHRSMHLVVREGSEGHPATVAFRVAVMNALRVLGH